MSEVEIRPVALEDRPWVKDFSVGRWGAEIIVVHGTVLTYEIRDAACEIVTLDSIQPGIGVGSALVIV